MEAWLLTIVSLCLAALIKSILSRRRSPVNLPPGPSLLHSNLLILLNPAIKFESVLINLKAKYGPIFTLSTGLGPSIFISNHSLAHEVLIKKGAVFSDRPKFFINFNISTTSYGPTWRLLRRNLASEVMNTACMKSYSSARKWALNNLISGLITLMEHQDYEAGLKVVDHFHNVIFRLMVLMCFGDKFHDDKIKEIAKVQREMLTLVGSGRFTMLSMFPRVGRLMFRKIWKRFEKLRDNKEKVMVPIIISRVESACSGSDIVAYVDTLANLRLSEDEDDNRNGGKLMDREIVGLCSEFLTGGTDSTASALQWIMANLVKHPHIQSKLYDDIVAVVGPPPHKGVDVGARPEINEEDLQNMQYLKAVILEGLRRHPPAHFV